MFFVLSRGLKDIGHARKLRKEVFVEEQGVSIKLEQDSKDEDAYHLVLFNDGVAIGVGRILLEGDIAILGRIAIKKEYRCDGYGGVLLMKLIERAKNEFGMKSIELHSQVDVVGFYKKYGFEEVGHQYLEAGILHQNMVLKEKDLMNYGFYEK